MANDRYRYDPDRYSDRSGNWRGRDEAYGSRRRYGSDFSSNEGRREEDGYIARRGFGNRAAGYEPNRSDEDRYESSRERDFGSSTGYGSGGSARDWRDVVGDDRRRGMTGYGVDYSRDRDWQGGYRSSFDENRDRYGTGFFGRGSRDYGEERGFLERAGDEVRSWFGDDDADRRRDMDVRRAENDHRGRGPKGYQRSDERIREDVNDRLTDDPHIDASEIEVMVVSREVTLSGTVPGRFEKRHAEDIAESVSGVTHVQNNLRVQPSGDTGMRSGLSSGSGMAGSSGGDTMGSGQDTSRRRTPSTSGT